MRSTNAELVDGLFLSGDVCAATVAATPALIVRIAPSNRETLVMIMVLKVMVTSVDTEAETAWAAVPRETKLTRRLPSPG